MDKQSAIRMLNEDIAGEHGAIVLYLRLAYALGEGEMAADIEEIARDEMRHYKWLCEEVVRLGGEPTLEREETPAGSAGALALVETAIQSEEGATGQYEAHAEAIGEPRIVALLHRIASDERFHFEKFRRLHQQLQAEPAPAPSEPPAPQDVEPLQQDVATEYTTLLQYLHQSFLTPDCELSKDLQDQAIIEMKHMGWLAEHVAESGGEPRLEHGEIDRDLDPEHILRANVALEVAVEDLYRQHTAAAQEPGLRSLLQRILEHSEYHEAHFNHLLGDVQARQAARSEQAAPAPAPPAPPPSGWTVGSLLGRRQD